MLSFSKLNKKLTRTFIFLGVIVPLFASAYSCSLLFGKIDFRWDGSYTILSPWPIDPNRPTSPGVALQDLVNNFNETYKNDLPKGKKFTLSALRSYDSVNNQLEKELRAGTIPSLVYIGINDGAGIAWSYRKHVDLSKYDEDKSVYNSLSDYAREEAKYVLGSGSEKSGSYLYVPVARSSETLVTNIPVLNNLVRKIFDRNRDSQNIVKLTQLFNESFFVQKIYDSSNYNEYRKNRLSNYEHLMSRMSENLVYYDSGDGIRYTPASSFDEEESTINSIWNFSDSLKKDEIKSLSEEFFTLLSKWNFGTNYKDLLRFTVVVNTLFPNTNKTNYALGVDYVQNMLNTLLFSRAGKQDLDKYIYEKKITPDNKEYINWSIFKNNPDEKEKEVLRNFREVFDTIIEPINKSSILLQKGGFYSSNDFKIMRTLFSISSTSGVNFHYSPYRKNYTSEEINSYKKSIKSLTQIYVQDSTPVFYDENSKDGFISSQGGSSGLLNVGNSSEAEVAKKWGYKFLKYWLGLDNPRSENYQVLGSSENFFNRTGYIPGINKLPPTTSTSADYARNLYNKLSSKSFTYPNGDKIESVSVFPIPLNDKSSKFKEVIGERVRSLTNTTQSFDNFLSSLKEKARKAQVF